MAQESLTFQVKSGQLAQADVDDDAYDVNEMSCYNNEAHCTNLFQLMQVQRSDKRFCDATLIANNRTFEVHRCVVAASSPYLENLLNKGESGGDLITLAISNIKVMKILLDYMYTGTLAVNMDIASDMIAASKLLEMNEVLQGVSIHVLGNISLSTWVQVEELGRKHKLSNVTQEVQNFIAENFSQLSSTTNFLELNEECFETVLNQAGVVDDSQSAQICLTTILNWVAQDEHRLSNYPRLLKLVDAKGLQLNNTLAAFSAPKVISSGLADRPESQELLAKLSIDEIEPTAEDAFADVTDMAGPRKRGRKPNQPARYMDNEENKAAIGNVHTFQKSPVKIKSEPETTPPVKRKRGRPPKHPKTPNFTPVKQPREESVAPTPPPAPPASSSILSSSSSPGEFVQCEWPNCTNVFPAKRVNDYRDHMNAHKGYKPHECAVCGKSFSARKHKQRHEKIHLDVPPIPCTIPGCDWRTTRRDKLQQHIISKHPNYTYTGYN